LQLYKLVRLTSAMLPRSRVIRRYWSRAGRATARLRQPKSACGWRWKGMCRNRAVFGIRRAWPLFWRRLTLRASRG